MAINIIVCVKPVPASDNVTIDPTTKTVRRSASESVISTLDKNALELAAQLKKQEDCNVTVLSMAPAASAEKCIREAMARGGDKAVILSDRAFAGGDTFATSYALSCAIKHIGGADLIITGAASDDGGTGQLSVQLAEWLGIQHLHNASSVKLNGNKLTVETKADGQMLNWECDLPALISVNRSINRVGPVSVRNIVAAARKELTVLSAANLPELDAGRIGLKNSPTQNGELYPIDGSRSGKIIEGDDETLANEIITRLSAVGITL